MSVLGNFSVGLHGRVTQLKSATDSHAALEETAHGATANAVVDTLMRRDAIGRAAVVSPAASDNSQLIATTQWVQGELGGGGGGSVTSITQGTGMSFSVNPLITTGTIGLANTSVIANSYTLANITVDAQGRLTSASNGTAVASVSSTSPITITGTASVPVVGIPAATGSVNGYMSSSDKSKLDNIDAGATDGPIDSVFGRTGVVVAVANDYNISEIEGHTISDTAATGGSDGDIWFEY